jgi:hypothetical protein
MNKAILLLLFFLTSFFGYAQTTSKRITFDDQWLFQKAITNNGLMPAITTLIGKL